MAGGAPLYLSPGMNIAWTGDLVSYQASISGVSKRHNNTLFMNLRPYLPLVTQVTVGAWKRKIVKVGEKVVR